MTITEKTSTPSIVQAVQKMRELMTRPEKVKVLSIATLALIVSIMEIVTASVIVIFAQVLTDPAVGMDYLGYIGISEGINSSRLVFYASIVVAIVYMTKNFMAGIDVFFQNFAIQRMSFDFKGKMLRRYAHLDYGLYLMRNSSFGINVITQDVEKVFSVGMVSMATIFSEGIVFICLVGMVIYINPPLAFIIFALGLVGAVFLSKFLFPRFYYWGGELQDATMLVYQKLLQFFHAFKEIVLMGKREEFIGAYQHHSWQLTRVQAIQASINALPRLVIETIFVFIFVVAISFLSIEQDASLEMMGVLGGYLYVGFRLMPGLNRIINQLSNLKSVIPSIDRTHAEYKSVMQEQTYQNVEGFHFEEDIIFRNVGFSYLNVEKRALSKIDWRIKKGEWIGVIGETGSGKSTLIDLLLGLLRPVEGEVLVDGKYPTSTLQWHEKIGYVPQSVYLIDDTIEANIVFGEVDVDQEKLRHVVEFSQLSRLISCLDDGVKTLVGERGVRLSGGERQRIAIARALYRDPEVLIFDEATSALDNETEESLMETINIVGRNRTVIMIAHRLSTLKDCDRIYKMENGCIEQVTNYKDFIKNR